MKKTFAHGKSAPEPRREALAGQHIAQLQAALLAAFSLDELAKMLRVELSFDMPAVVAVQGRTLDAITYDLVVWELRKPEVGLQGLLAAACRTNPENAKLQALHTAWEGLTFAPPACPYPGMRPFTAAVRERLYGRSGEVRQAVGALRRHPFLAVIGPSGSGKSSLLAAGLVPELLVSPPFTDLPWTIETIRHGSQPQAAPANVINDPSAPGQEGSRLLLVVDQFKELFPEGEASQHEPFPSSRKRS